MALSKPQPLEDRIKTLHADLEAAITAYVQEIAKTCQGVPEGVIRQTETLTGGRCVCRDVLAILAKRAAA